MKEARAQVHFHKGETASCIISVTSSGKEAIADELLLWSCFAVRQLNNMGRDAPTLASLLANVAEGLEQLANHDGQGPKLLNQHRATARKRFEAALVPYRDGFRFRLRMKGFGILGRGLGYYCPLSALLLLRHMAKRRRGEPRYMACLEKLAAITGGAFLAGYINMRNGNERAHQNLL